jgi:AbrB family looped-hinge helix DNA binding protein
LADLSKKEMGALTQGLRTKADKIRALARARVAPADIARFLGIRYQHAYNVLKRSAASNVVMDAPAHGGGLGTARVTVDSFGRIAIPEDLRNALGVGAGDELLMSVDGDELRLFTRAAGLRAAQRIVSKYLRRGDSLSEELIGDRRREAADERG